MARSFSWRTIPIIRLLIGFSPAKHCQEGDTVEIESVLGRITVRPKFDPNQRQDVALIGKGGWVAQRVLRHPDHTRRIDRPR